MLKSAVVSSLLFAVVASSIGGAEVLFFCILLAAWFLFPVLVGLRDSLDTGCVFMLVALGIVVMVGLAQNGPNYLLP